MTCRVRTARRNEPHGSNGRNAPVEREDRTSAVAKPAAVGTALSLSLRRNASTRSPTAQCCTLLVGTQSGRYVPDVRRQEAPPPPRPLPIGCGEHDLDARRWLP